MSIWSIIFAILILALCVFIHELGHFLSAIVLGIPVEEFSLGFGHKLWQRRIRGIKYSIRIVPLGGYVRYCLDDSDVMGREESGESLEEAIAAAGDKSYINQPAWKRFISAFFGPFMNVLLAFGVAVAIYVMIGNPVSVPRVAQYSTDSPAYAAGIEAGDIIVAVNGAEISYDTQGLETASSIIAASQGNPITLTVERDGGRVDLIVTPVYDESNGRYMIGIYFGTTYSPCTIGQAVTRAGTYMVRFTVGMYESLGSLFTGNQAITDQLTGPVGTVQIISEQVQKGGFETLQILMMISLNLGLLNLLPIPGLDGFKLILLLIEMIRRKPVPPKYEAAVSLAGLALLFGLMIFITFSDVAKLIGG